MNCQLEKIITKDKIELDGVFFKPKKSGKKALLYVHGLSGNFYGSCKILNAFAQEFNKFGFGLACFNTRGHDLVAGVKKINKRKKDGYERLTLGAAFEKFENCIFDIDAGINFLKSKGFTEIIIVGISTGANKTAYYFSKSQNKHAKAGILLSPICDRLALKKDLGKNFNKKLKARLKKAKKMVTLKQGNKLMLQDKNEFSFSANRVLSLYTNESNEDTFPYDIPQAKFKILSKIKKPMLTVFGNADKYLDRPIEQIIEIFREKSKKAKNFDSAIIENASHSYGGHEKELAKIIINWIKKI